MTAPKNSLFFDKFAPAAQANPLSLSILVFIEPVEASAGDAGF
jgi:hypothetical protein